MATKTITGAYNNGYSLDPRYSTLDISTTATVGGAGVTTTSAARSTINNLGAVHGSGNGITLSDGGTITNGSSSNASASIEGANPIVVDKGTGALTNWGVVSSDQTSAHSTVFKYNYYYYDRTVSQAVSVAMNAGGSVVNQNNAQIGSGVSLTSGTVTNNGTIGAAISDYYQDRYSAHRNTVDTTSKYDSGISVSMSGGGRVVNGSASNANASISSSVEIDGGRGTVTNFGTINAHDSTTSYDFNYYKIGYHSSQHGITTSASVVLTAGGAVSNLGSSASVNGISIAGGSGTIVNEGRIRGPQNITYKHFEAAPAYTHIAVGPSVNLAAGGSVTNRASGTIDNGIQISGGVGTVSNLGTVAGTVSYTATKADGASAKTTTHVGYSATLGGTGSIANGASGNIVNGVKFSGAGKISNLGTIGPTSTAVYNPSTQQTTTTYGLAVDLLAGGSVTNGSASVTNALIHGTVHTEGGAATIINFGTIAGGNANVGLDLQANATVTNGTASDTNAVITGTVGIQTGTGTVQVKNFGVIQGTGGVAVSFGASTQTLVEEGSGTLAGTVAGHGGTLELGAAAGAGHLTGLGSSITDFAKLVVDAGSNWTLSGTNALMPTALAPTVSLTNSGTLTNSGAFEIGGQIVNSGTITNASGATFDIDGDFGVAVAASMKGTINNAGTLEKIAGTGTSLIRTGNGTLTDTGTINVMSGTLELSGYAVKISGTLAGSGTIEFGPGSATLLAGTSLNGLQSLLVSGTAAVTTVATNLGYANSFSATAGGTLAVNAGNVFTLSGTAGFARAKVGGTGELLTSGATSLNVVTLGGTAQWVNAGTVTETGALTLGDAANHKVVFTNQSGGTFDLVGNVGIALGGATTSSFVNQGLLAKTAGATSAVAVGLVNTGTIEVASGTLDLQKAVSGTGGTLKIDAGKILQVDAAVGNRQTVTFGGGNDRLVLTDAKDFAATLSNFGSADKLDLTQFASTGTTLSFVENAQNTGGTLTVTNGSLTANIAMSGQYATSGFSQASDGKGGDLIGYKPPATTQATSMAAAQPTAHHDAFAMALFDAASTTSGTTDLAGAAALGKSSPTLAADPLAATPVHAAG